MASFYRGIFISCVQSTLGDFPSEQRGRSWSKAIPCLPGHCGRLGPQRTTLVPATIALLESPHAPLWSLRAPAASVARVTVPVIPATPGGAGHRCGPAGGPVSLPPRGRSGLTEAPSGRPGASGAPDTGGGGGSAGQSGTTSAPPLQNRNPGRPAPAGRKKCLTPGGRSPVSREDRREAKVRECRELGEVGAARARRAPRPGPQRARLPKAALRFRAPLRPARCAPQGRKGQEDGERALPGDCVCLLRPDSAVLCPLALRQAWGGSAPWWPLAVMATVFFLGTTRVSPRFILSS